MPSSVTWPIGVALSSHLAQHRLDLGTLAGSATTSMRSCDSREQDLVRRHPLFPRGHQPVSISTPTPPRAAISADELVSPAAPMS